MVKNSIFVAVVIGIFSLLYFLSTETVVPIPPDDLHIGITDESGCLGCHGDGKEFARKKEHPPKDRCFQCHTVSEDHTNAQE